MTQPQDRPSFYQAMSYPCPLESEYYRYISEVQTTSSKAAYAPQRASFSRSHKTERMQSYEAFVTRYSKLFRWLPFVTQVYLCNSMTFNALHKDSDIDLVILTKPGYLRYARVWSWMLVALQGLRRRPGKGHHAYKFCLSFYIDAEHSNLISLRQDSGDIYLSYRIAHAVLIYTDHQYSDDYLFRSNPQLLSYLPHHPHTQTINLDIPLVRGKARGAYMIELAGSTWIGNIIQRGIQRLRGDLINHYKNKKLSHYQQQYIVISPTMLKFHNDKRVLYHRRRKDTIANR